MRGGRAWRRVPTGTTAGKHGDGTDQHSGARPTRPRAAPRRCTSPDLQRSPPRPAVLAHRPPAGAIPPHLGLPPLGRGRPCQLFGRNGLPAQNGPSRPCRASNLCLPSGSLGPPGRTRHLVDKRTSRARSSPAAGRGSPASGHQAGGGPQAGAGGPSRTPERVRLCTLVPDRRLGSRLGLPRGVGRPTIISDLARVHPAGVRMWRWARPAGAKGRITSTVVVDYCPLILRGRRSGGDLLSC